MLCAIWYHFYNLKNVKNTHGRVLLLVKLQAILDDLASYLIVYFLQLICIGSLICILKQKFVQS